MRTLAALTLALALTGVVTARAADVPLPGDHPPKVAGPPGDRTTDPAAPTPSIDLALKAAQAIAAACKQYPMSLAVVDSEGVAKLIYVPDGSAAWHGYSAVRKAYTAITFKSDTSKVVKQAATDPALMDQFKADHNLARRAGGLVLMAGGKVIGAIGVSGAEPGGHDEECGNIGRDKIKNDLK